MFYGGKSVGLKLWKIREQPESEIESLARDSGLSWVLCAVLMSRGIKSAAEAKAFISDLGKLDDPFVMKDMDKAVSRITEAIEDGERIAVYGDYDCDGVTATALLVSYLQSVGADVIYYIPSREKEGYGLNRQAIKMLEGQKAGVIVTVDNGVSAHDEIEYANSLGIDVVVTDHHTPRDTMPPAVAVVNPRRSDCPSGYKELAGVGVAFKLVCALENAEPYELLEYYSDLAALGTVADVVPLTGENRTIVKHGLSRLAESDKPGIAALLEASGLAGKELSCESAAFGIIPRINAAGRMGVVDDVVELLLTDDTSYAAEIAELMNERNAERKKAEDCIVLEIDEILKKNPEILKKRVLVLWGENWHHGVIGIVASKLMERYGKPCLLLSSDGESARGSGRSLPGFSLIEAISACSSHLTRYGGHTLAAGLTLPASSLDAFDAELQAFARDKYPKMPVAACDIACILPMRELTVESISTLTALEPFGAANEQPLFLLQKLWIDGVYPTNDKKHLRIRFSSGGSQFYAVYFRMTEQEFPYKQGDTVDVVATVSIQEYNGKSQLSIKIRDLRPSNLEQERILAENEVYSCYLRDEHSAPDLPLLLAEREDIAVVYRFLRKNGGFYQDTLPLYCGISKSGVGYAKMLISLDVMREMGLIGDSGGRITVTPDPPKVDIEESAILTKLKTGLQVRQGG